MEPASQAATAVLAHVNAWQRRPPACLALADALVELAPVSPAPLSACFDNILEASEHFLPVGPGVLGLFHARVVVLSQRDHRRAIALADVVGDRVVVLGYVVLAGQGAEMGDLETALVLDLEDLALVLVGPTFVLTPSR